MQVKGILFDCDGVLLDSELLFAKSVMQFLGKYGIDADLRDIYGLTGQINEKICSDLKEKYLKNTEVSVDEIDRQLEEFYELNYKVENYKPFPGLKYFLEYCIGLKLCLVVVSSSERDYLDSVMNQLGISKYFSLIVSGDDVVHGKPDPEIYEKAVRATGIDKENLIVIEDSKNGIQAAKNAGLYTVGFTASLIQQDVSQADIVKGSYEELESWLRRNERCG